MRFFMVFLRYFTLNQRKNNIKLPIFYKSEFPSTFALQASQNVVFVYLVYLFCLNNFSTDFMTLQNHSIFKLLY